MKRSVFGLDSVRDSTLVNFRAEGRSIDIVVRLLQEYAPDVT